LDEQAHDYYNPKYASHNSVKTLTEKGPTIGNFRNRPSVDHINEKWPAQVSSCLPATGLKIQKQPSTSRGRPEEILAAFN
jgi:hypothetical protein